MAARYSGDVVVRVLHLHGTRYSVSLSSPRTRLSQEIDVAVKRRENPASSESYDRVARALLIAASHRVSSLPVERDERGEIVVRRVFQAPCPLRP